MKQESHIIYWNLSDNIKQKSLELMNYRADKNEELDLILEIGPFHHSENLAITMAESHRVLKKGGTLIAIERAHSDKVVDEYLDELLEEEMPDQAKEKYGIKSNARKIYVFNRYSFKTCFIGIK